MAGVSFQLLNIDDPLPAQYRLATTQEVRANKRALFQAMTGWEIANLANGSVDGAAYGGNVRYNIRNDVGHKLVTFDPSSFMLLNINDQLSSRYRQATVQDVQANREALFHAMPGWEIANLANGSVDGAAYGGDIRMNIRNDVGHKLATFRPRSFQLFNIGDMLPYEHRLATVTEVNNNRQALFQAMPGWEIANLADGSVDGAAYGGRTRTRQRNDVGHKLAAVF